MKMRINPIIKKIKIKQPKIHLAMHSSRLPSHQNLLLQIKTSKSNKMIPNLKRKKIKKQKLLHQFCPIKFRAQIKNREMKKQICLIELNMFHPSYLLNLMIYRKNRKMRKWIFEIQKMVMKKIKLLIALIWS